MYDVLLNNIPVGNVQVDREGLYYKFQCSCRFPQNRIYRIRVSDGKSEIMLGVCIPKGDQFVLNTKIPTKKIQGETLLFTAETQNEMGICVESGMSFAYLDKLETARLQNTNGQFRIVID